MGTKSKKSQSTQKEQRQQAKKRSVEKQSLSDMDTADSDYEPEASNKLQDHYLLSLLICFLGVVACYSGYAILQESLLADKSKKMNTNFVMGVQQVFAAMIAAGIIKGFKLGEGPLMEDFSRGDLVVGTLNFLTMYCSNFALKFVNYPFMALAKSAKILPVILTGWLTGAYKLHRSQVIIAITISTGLVIFNSNKVKGGFSDDSYFGIFLVILSLLLDGFVNAQTDKNHQAKKRVYAYHTMVYNNLVGVSANVAFFAFACFYNGDTTLQRVATDFKLLRDVIMISLCGAVGQIFIYLTISLHDCVKLSIMTTTRKCLTVVISAFLFNHGFSAFQWFGATLVLASTVAEVYLGNKRKQQKTIEERL